ncbi:single-stranded DNA-binding protein [Candidatus Saccharibacteria bacterium]|nr:single-stranded DNA-binding protein [Candidatus Saccharibacteria bacterium]
MVKGFNKVMLMGNLTRDPETRNTPSGQSVTRFSLAVNRSWRGQDGSQHEETGFFDCSAWGKLGETIAQYLKKGDPIFISGRLNYSSWEDQATKTKRSKVEVVVEDMNFISSKGGGERSGGYGAAASGEKAVSGEAQPSPSLNKATDVNLDDIDENTEIDLSEVPF